MKLLKLFKKLHLIKLSINNIKDLLYLLYLLITYYFKVNTLRLNFNLMISFKLFYFIPFIKINNIVNLKIYYKILNKT